MPGAAFARLVAFDGLIHGWDLAIATGHAYAVHDEVVAAVDDLPLRGPRPRCGTGTRSKPRRARRRERANLSASWRSADE